MFDTAEIAGMQRSRGEAFVSLVADGDAPRIAGLRQQGSAKVILPHVGKWPEAVFLNTSGGLTGGDCLSYRVDLGHGLRAVATTQTAERAYRSGSGAASVKVDLTVGDAAFLDWLPQETILFDGADLDRHTQVTLGHGAGCLVLEMIVLGRQAMGETVRQANLRDWRQIDGPTGPIWAEPLRIDERALASGPAGLNGTRAFASLCLVAPEAEALLSPLRRTFDEPGVRAAASYLPGRLVMRADAADGWPLRRQVARSLAVLRQGRALPRVWQM